MFKNRMLKIIFGPKKDYVIGRRTKLHSEELRNIHSSPNVISPFK